MAQKKTTPAHGAKTEKAIALFKREQKKKTPSRQKFIENLTKAFPSMTPAYAGNRWQACKTWDANGEI